MLIKEETTQNYREYYYDEFLILVLLNNKI